MLRYPSGSEAEQAIGRKRKKALPRFIDGYPVSELLTPDEYIIQDTETAKLVRHSATILLVGCHHVKDNRKLTKAWVKIWASRCFHQPAFTGPVWLNILYLFNPVDFHIHPSAPQILSAEDGRIGDVDNHTKPIQDGMEGIVFMDDKQVRYSGINKQLTNGVSRVIIKVEGTYLP